MQKHSKGRLVVAHSDMGIIKPTRAIWIKKGDTECILAVVQYPDTYTGSNGGAEREANAHVLGASFDLLDACQLQHAAIDMLMAMLIEAKPGFMPTKSPCWSAVVAGNAAILKATGGAS